MKVALTGATGFVGLHVARGLLGRGDTVVCLVRLRSRACEIVASGADVVEGDLAQPEALDRLAAGTDVVLHVAGLVAARTEEEFLRVNRDGTAALARAARKAGVSRFLYVSSLAATGPSLPDAPVDEKTPPHPVTAYGRSKLAGEHVLAAEGVPHLVLRPPAVYGPGDRAFLPLFRMASLGLVPVLGNGQQVLSLIHVRDLAEALVELVHFPVPAAGQVFHAAHPEAITQRALVQAVGRAVGRDTVHVIPLPESVVRALLLVSAGVARLRRRTTQLSPGKAPEFLARAWTCSSRALARSIGWSARLPHASGLAETAAWYRQQGWLR
jgi:nucleoside-diphosphate-sugar epimerase